MAQGGYDDSTPLHIAAWNGNVEVLRVLLEAGAEIDIVSGPIHTNSPLGWAIVSGAAEIVNLCMERGAEIQTFHVEDADAGRRGEFRHWSAASQDARVQIAKKVRK